MVVGFWHVGLEFFVLSRVYFLQGERFCCTCMDTVEPVFSFNKMIVEMNIKQD